MSIALPWIALVFVGFTLVLARRELDWGPTAAWLALAAGLGFVMWGGATLPAAIAVASVAGIAVVGVGAPGSQLRHAAFAAVVPVAVAVAAVVCMPDGAAPFGGEWGGNLVLFTAGWAAQVAALSSFVVALGARRRPLTFALPVALTAAACSIWVAGTGRGSLDAAYGFSLRSGDEILRWVLGPVPRFESGIRLAVAVDVPSVQAGLWILAALGVVAAGAIYLGKRSASVGALGATVLGAVGLLGALPIIVPSLSMPSADPYADEVKRRLLTRGREQVVDTGAFSGSGDISVAMADLAPEIFGLTFIAVLAFVGLVSLRAESADETDVDHRAQRELMSRGVGFLWVSWFVLLILHNGMLGSPGMGSPGEWVFTGMCLVATGVTFASAEAAKTKFGVALTELAPALIIAGLLLVTALAWRFGALPGLSLGVLG